MFFCLLAAQRWKQTFCIVSMQTNEVNFFHSPLPIGKMKKQNPFLSSKAIHAIQHNTCKGTMSVLIIFTITTRAQRCLAFHLEPHFNHGP